MSKKIIFLFLSFLVLTACASFEGIFADQPSIDSFDPASFAIEKREQVSDTASLGPQIESEGSLEQVVNRRIFIDENIVIDYTKIIDKNFAETFPISVNFDNVDIRTVMQTFSSVTGKNILVGDEVTGTVKARIIEEDWDDVLEAILEIKGIALTLNPNTNIVRIHSKEVISAQEEYNKKRKKELRLAMELTKSIAPVRSEIFRLYYSSPETVKSQVNEILKNIDASAAAGEEGAGAGSGGASSRVKITVDARLRALIVLGTMEDLNFIEKLINEIDVPTQQILIEAFVVTVTDSFEKNLGTRLGMYYGPDKIDDASHTTIAAGGTLGGPATATAVGTLGTVGTASVGSMAANTISSATGSIGMILDAHSIDLNFELQALETDSISKTIANPKIFTLDNQTATIEQGVQVPYTTSSAEGTTTEFKEATLKLEVTPSIVGDGNIILDIKVNNDKPGTAAAGSAPPINKTAIKTKLLVKDQSIVIIGGIFTDTLSNANSETPGLADIPVFGNLFKMKKDSDLFDRVFIFIAPKIL